MVFQKVKPRPPLKVKTCAICRKSFQPSSGAQKICGEPECKARSRMQKYLEKKAKKKDETQEVRVAKTDRVPARKNHHSETDVPDLELDLSPLAAYIKAMIADALKHMQSCPDKSDEELREMVRELVREELASRLKPLFGRA
jgi:hypothetical protein